MPEESICRRDGNVQKHTGLHRWIVYDSHITASLQIQVKYSQLFKNSAHIQCSLYTAVLKREPMSPFWDVPSSHLKAATALLPALPCADTESASHRKPPCLTSHIRPLLLSWGRTISTDGKPWCEGVLVWCRASDIQAFLALSRTTLLRDTVSQSILLLFYPNAFIREPSCSVLFLSVRH